MKKHIIIAGASRSGKTTLSLMLRKLGYTHYKMDSIKRGIFNNFTNDDEHNWKEISSKMVKLIDTIIEDSFSDTNFNKEWYVFDIPYLYPCDALKLKSKNVIIIYLGYTDISADEAFKNIKRNDKLNYWSRSLKDEELKKIIKLNKEHSNELKRECKKYNIKYYDTGYNREDVLNEIYNYIKKVINLGDEKMKDIIVLLTKQNKTISTMESCTGGGVANSITDVEGASEVIKFSAVTYSNEFKIKMGVSKDVINKYSVYSMETANEMSYNISKFSNSNYGVGITGKLNRVDKNNPFGEDNVVFISIYDNDNNVYYNEIVNATKSSRKENKELVINKTIKMILKIIKK